MGLYKRGKVWTMTFTYRGRQYLKSTKTGDQRLAQRIYDKVRGEIAENRWFEKLPGEDKSFGDMVEKFKEESIPKRSYAVYTSVLRTLFEAFRDYPLASITPNIVNRFKKQLKNKGEKTATINQRIRILKRMFNVATGEWEWFKENPIRFVHLEREGKKRDRWATQKEEEIIFSHSPLWLRELMILALNTGLRISEICNLQIPHVDLSRKIISIIETKNDQPRIIPLNQEAYDLLREKLKVRSISSNHVFQFKGKSIQKHIIEIAFRGVCLVGEIEDFHFHDLRHTFATRLAQAGIDLYKIQVLLGHKSPSMTQRYAHHDSESLRSSVEVLDTLSKSDHFQKAHG